MSRRFPLAALAVALLVALPALAQDAPATKKIPNPEFENWSRFAVGAFVELTTEADNAGQKSTSKLSHKLVELTAEKAVVETTMEIPGVPAEYAPKPTRRDVPKEIEVPATTRPEDLRPQYRPKEGEETIDVAGTSVKCKTVEQTVEAEGMTTWVKTWTSADVPGMLAKTTSKTEGTVGETPFTSAQTTTVTKWAAK